MGNSHANQATAKSAKAFKQKVSGVILIDKPIGMTSQQVVSKVKYLLKSDHFDSKKAGHTGTLDPMATGLLPICLGEATKFSHYQLDADKTYQATVLLGSQTDTGDADGQIIATQSLPNITDDLLAQVCQRFLGEQLQTPPMYSALKKDGKKLYELARQGIEIDRPSRPITIKALELSLIAPDKLQLIVTCSKGTYVRVLGEDIAKALGTLGHLTQLRRLQVGQFDITHALTLPQLEALEHSARIAQLLPIDACIELDATLVLSPEQCSRIQLGQRLNVKSQITPEIASLIQNSRDELTDIKLISETGLFLGLGSIESSGRLQPKKLINLS
ncbi:MULTISPECIES: tRNA pseudouridine(55) synthase TruB [Psychrobacter]|uniref:tRNA pseudouridine(55) synthase TruB n=1 Tax=Psychrobacter TaxID=497 RepID=UPI00146A140B|nr:MULTISPECIES: tRNA pseudouridine(55) synthase TruB [Psychrobacter]